jgi:Helix-turn-helix domain
MSKQTNAIPVTTIGKNTLHLIRLDQQGTIVLREKLARGEANSSNGNVTRKQLPSSAVKLLTPKEAAQWLKVSESWLAKARMRGDGPPFIKIGRSIRYSEVCLVGFAKRNLFIK